MNLISQRPQKWMQVWNKIAKPIAATSLLKDLFPNSLSQN